MDGTSFIPYLRSLQQAVDKKQNASLQAFDNKRDIPLTSSIEDPYHREDFLISYYGEANPDCGVQTKNCLDPQEYIGDSFNNSYHCVRSITTGSNQPTSVASLKKKDSIYCVFDDEEDFVEYYDHLKDPWQLQNRANELSAYEHEQFKARISILRSCQGTQCHQSPSNRSKPMMTVSYESSGGIIGYPQSTAMMVIMSSVFVTLVNSRDVC
jgi:hypothetical protein